MSKKTPQSEKKGKDKELVVIDFNPQLPIGLKVEAIQQNKTKTTPLRTFRIQALPVERGSLAYWLFVCSDGIADNTLLFSQSLLPSPASKLEFVKQFHLHNFQDLHTELAKLEETTQENNRGTGQRQGICFLQP
jgi:hypothetical protein